MPGYKIIHDSIHGSVRVEGLFLSLLERPEMQRLHGIHQLGLAHLVFPGANHTRLEHSLGTYHMASRLCTALELEEEDRQTVLAAAMLHDIGHTPYSHTLEEVICHRLGKDHANVSSDLIVGDYRPYEDRDIEVIGNIPPLPDLLEQNGVAPDKVADLVTTVNHSDPAQSTFAVEAGQAHFGQRNFLHQIISGPLDVDQMDYLLRDAHYTGVAHGTIDIDRLLHTMMIHHGDLVVQKGGLVAVEGLLVARSLMYTSVYFHKTVRIAEMMLCKAVEAAPP
ncbi:MAG: HD domain-containing protein, partial [Euryarchaeota archaeon]|nr:HD domain-containing protein [Euryarchaeota archaeon]